MADTVFLTREIQLLLNTPDPAEKQAYKEKLKTWQFLYFRAANLILTHLFVQVGIKQLFYIEEGVNLKLANAARDSDGIFTTSKENTTCQLLSRTFKGEIPISFLTELNHRLTQEFNRNREAYLNGENHLPQPRRDLPLQFSARDMRQVSLTEDERNYRFCLYGVPFKTYLGRDCRDKKKVLDEWAAGSLKLRNCSLQLKEGKFYLIVGFERPVVADPAASAIAEVSLSLECPLRVTIGTFSYAIGNQEEFLHRRLAIKAARQRMRASLAGARPGKGVKRKTKAVRHYASIEKNYINHQLHVYSRKLVDLCRRRRVGTILLVNQQQKEEAAKGDPFLLQNWSYYNLKQKIEYKAAKAGIGVIVE